jgi:hypothetical protein
VSAAVFFQLRDGLVKSIRVRVDPAEIRRVGASADHA